jgi:hypothetical protein
MRTGRITNLVRHTLIRVDLIKITNLKDPLLQEQN